MSFYHYLLWTYLWVSNLRSYNPLRNCLSKVSYRISLLLFFPVFFVSLLLTSPLIHFSCHTDSVHFFIHQLNHTRLFHKLAQISLHLTSLSPLDPPPFIVISCSSKNCVVQYISSTEWSPYFCYYRARSRIPGACLTDNGWSHTDYNRAEALYINTSLVCAPNIGFTTGVPHWHAAWAARNSSCVYIPHFHRVFTNISRIWCNVFLQSSDL